MPPRYPPAGRDKPRAIVFGFDGTIIGAEVPVYGAWASIYAGHGCRLVSDEWRFVAYWARSRPPDEVTAGLDFSAADLGVGSLAELPLSRA